MDSALHSSSSKRRRLSQSQELLCIPCWRSWWFAGETLKNAFEIYFVDLASTDYSICKILSPTLLIDADYFQAHTVCVLGSKLYMFQSNHYPNLHGSGTCVATIKLSKYLTKTNVKVDDNMIRYTTSMWHSKKSPKAIPTLDGKLLVFSSHILFNPHIDDETTRPFDFELYDPATKRWKILPRIYDNWERKRKLCCGSFSVHAAGFITESTLIIKTEIGMFELELESSRGWQDWVTPARKIPRHPGVSFSVIGGGELYFSPYYAFDINTPKIDNVCCEFPRIAFDTNDYELRASDGIVQTLADDGKCNFCLVQTAINVHTKYPHLVIEVYNCDLAKYREDKHNMIVKYKEDKKYLKAKYKEDKQKLKDNYRGDDSSKKTARLDVKEKYLQDKMDLKFEEATQLSTRVDKSFKFDLDSQSSSFFAPLTLSFVC